MELLASGNAWGTYYSDYLNDYSYSAKRLCYIEVQFDGKDFPSIVPPLKIGLGGSVGKSVTQKDPRHIVESYALSLTNDGRTMLAL